MPDDAHPASKRRPGPHGASSDVRMRQLAEGAWEVGGSMTEQQIREERIRVAAYRLWVAAGRPDGRSDEFWQIAERLAALDPLSE
jgi:hypothetical protein